MVTDSMEMTLLFITSQHELMKQDKKVSPQI